MEKTSGIAVDKSEGRIKHPVESYRQLCAPLPWPRLSASGDSDAKYCFRNPGSKRTAICAASPANCAAASLPCLRSGPRFPPSARTFFARNQSPGNSPPACSVETGDITDRQHVRQRRVRTDSRLRHQQPGLRMLLGPPSAAPSSVPACWFNISSGPSKSSRRHDAQGFN